MHESLPLDRNHFQPSAPWPDEHGIPINAHGGGILFHQGVFYWYGEHKVGGEAGNRAEVGVRVYSSADLYNWTNQGVALAVSDDPRNDLARGCILERPKVLFCPRTERFVMWFHLELKGEGYLPARTGVAVADHPCGPFQFVKSFRPNAGHWPANIPDELKRPLSSEEERQLQGLHLPGSPVPDFPKDLLFRRDFAGGQMARDMTVFADDDKAYLIYASEENGTLHIAELTDDFQTTSGRYARFFAGAFREAPALFKRQGKYYLITSGCTGWEPNAAEVAVADSIFGPWRVLGNPCSGPQAEITFGAQSTHVLQVPDRPDTFIFMADQWNPSNAIDGRYLWLPIDFENERPLIRWTDRWRLGLLP
jgi:hypothetical protein